MMGPERARADDIHANVGRALERIAAAARRVGRDPGEIQLVAVTKGQAPDVIRLGYAAGLRDFGENRVEEALPKIAALSDLEGVRWHMIGHIQSRKARAVPGRFALIHSIDREKIARVLDRLAAGAGLRLPVLLECNVSGEASKEGWRLGNPGTWESVLDEIRQVICLPGLRVQGLMTMAPWTQDTEQIRQTFRRLRQLRDFLAGQLPGDWGMLSMGMTDDFEVAVEEGSTCVRIGRALFGRRSGDAGAAHM